MWAQQAGEEARLRAMENAWNQAVQLKDVRALEMLLGRELVMVDSSGKLMNRVMYINSVTAMVEHPEQIQNESMTVRVYGSIAIVSGVYRERGREAAGNYLYRERFTDTWVSRSGTWVCVASHATLITP